MNDLVVAILRSGTPLVYVTLAGVVAQRAGIWHLGLEGVMIIGAASTIIGIVLTGSLGLALIAAVVLCVLASVLLWFTIEKLKANPIIAGLGLTGLGVGGTTLASQSIFGSQASITAPFGLPRLGEAFGPFASLSVLVAAMPFVSQAVAVGEGRKYISALLTLDADNAKRWAAHNGLADASYADIVASPAAHEAVQNFIDRANQGLQRWERVKKFTILPQEFSVDEGEVTPSMKIRRSQIAEKYADEIDAMYDKEDIDE